MRKLKQVRQESIYRAQSRCFLEEQTTMTFKKENSIRTIIYSWMEPTLPFLQLVTIYDHTITGSKTEDQLPAEQEYHLGERANTLSTFKQEHQR